MIPLYFWLLKDHIANDKKQVRDLGNAFNTYKNLTLQSEPKSSISRQKE